MEQINKKTGCQADLTDLADGSRLRRCLETSSLLTNATSVGMAPQADATPIPDTSMFHPGLLVSDVIYHPSKTRLLREAQRAGCAVCNGMYMLLYQGAAAFKIWTGQEMPVELIRERYFFPPGPGLNFVSGGAALHRLFAQLLRICFSFLLRYL